MKLLQTKDYLLLIDNEAEIKEGDWVYNSEYQKVIKTSVEFKRALDSNITLHSIINKIIAYYPLNSEAKELNLPLLPNPFEDVDVEKLADNYAVDTQKVHPADSFIAKQSYIEGYKAAQSKGQFSLEVMKEAIKFAYNAGRRVERHAVPADFKFETYREELIQSLSTQQLPKEFVPEWETVTKGTNEFDFYEEDVLKTITNSEGKEVLVGTYKY